MNIKLLTEHHLEFLCLTGGCTGSSEFTLVKMSHCRKSHFMAQLCCFFRLIVLTFVLLFQIDCVDICVAFSDADGC